MDLSKACDCLPHDLLIAGLAAYGFENTALALLQHYWLPYKLKLTNFLPQRVKIGTTFSSYLEILRNVPQGSILGPILFNIFINDFTFFIKKIEVCNFADDATIYSGSLNYEEAHRKLSDNTHVTPNWFRINSIVANLGKFQIILVGSSLNNNNIIFVVENKHIKSNNEVKLLGITIDHKLTFTKQFMQYSKWNIWELWQK